MLINIYNPFPRKINTTKNKMKKTKLISIKVSKKVLSKLNELLIKNPLLKQENNNYTLLINVLISKYLEMVEEND